MLKTGVIIGAHREELHFGEKTVKGLPKDLEIIRIERGISNQREPDQPRSRRKTDLYELYEGIDRKARDRFQLLLDLHYGCCEEGWGADVFSVEAKFLNAMEDALKKPSRKTFPLPKEVRLIRVIPNAQSKRQAFDDRFPVCLSFLPEGILSGRHYHYVGLEFYLTSKKGRRSEHRLSRRLIQGVQACAGQYL